MKEREKDKPVDELIVMGAKIQALRQHRGLTQRDFGDLIGGLSQMVVSAIERGVRPAGPLELLAISRFFGVSIEFLVDDEIESPNVAPRPPESARSEIHRHIWQQVQVLGPERALARLLAIPEPAGPPQTFVPEPRQATLFNATEFQNTVRKLRTGSRRSREKKAPPGPESTEGGQNGTPSEPQQVNRPVPKPAPKKSPGRLAPAKKTAAPVPRAQKKRPPGTSR